MSDGAQSYRVTKVASSPLPADPRPCAYLLPGTVNGNGSPESLAPIWTKPPDEIAVLAEAFPGGTCVVAVDAEGRRLGLTVDSLVCLSLDPPLVGFAVEAECPLVELLPAAGGCAISILAGGQTWLADHFAGGARPIAMWHGLASEPGAVGAPLFVGALGWLECSLLDVIDIGPQAMFVLAVRRAEAGSEAPALVRVRGAYQIA